MAPKSHRHVPGPLRKLLDFDANLSEKFCLFMNKFVPFRSLKLHHKALEITCHGILWLAGWIAFIYLNYSKSLYEMQVNFFIGLILDIIFVALIKAFVRRRRPAGNPPNSFGTFGPDIYSFPSGHASRASFIMLFFIFLFPLPVFCYLPLMAWVTSLCISRVLMKRHHILDVLAGILLGGFNSLVIKLLWINPDAASDLLSFLNDK